MTQYHKAVLSYKRPHNVEKMTEIVGSDVSWYVKEAEVDDYKKAGAKTVVSVPDDLTLVKTRNVILKEAWKKGHVCVQLDDDLKAIKRVVVLGANKIEKDISLVDALKLITKWLDEYKLYLGGVAPTNNAFFSNPNKPVTFQAFVRASLIVIKPCKVLFDEHQIVKHDYDYSLLHIQKYGGIIRCNDLLCSFGYGVNKGGLVEYRTPELSQKMIRRLKEKWGSLIKDNPKRPNEILLKFKRPNKRH